MAVVDRELLEKLAARPFAVIEPKRAPRTARPRLHGLVTRLTDRKKAPRYLLYGALMLAFYWLLGARAYLGGRAVHAAARGAGFAHGQRAGEAAGAV